MSELCYIIGAQCADLPVIRSHRRRLILCADGGYTALQQAGILPDAVLGDFDSLGYLPAHPNLIRHPVEKDDTDMALAVQYGRDRGFRRFLLYGGMGGRTDHTLGNLALLQQMAIRKEQGWLFGNGEVFTAISQGQTLRFPKEMHGIFSVFAAGGVAEGVTLEGFKYPLDRATLSPAVPLGVSNEFTGAPASVSVEAGTLLLFWQSSPQALLDLIEE